MGNTALDEHFKSAPRNATYRSPNIQNQIISGTRNFRYIIQRKARNHESTNSAAQGILRIYHWGV